MPAARVYIRVSADSISNPGESYLLPREATNEEGLLLSHVLRLLRDCSKLSKHFTVSVCIQPAHVPWMWGKETTAVLNQASIIHPMNLLGAK